MLHVLAILFALLAAGCMVVAIASMYTGRVSARMGWLIRVLAVLSFGVAVILNVVAHH